MRDEGDRGTVEERALWFKQPAQKEDKLGCAAGTGGALCPSLSEEEASVSQALKWKNQRHCENLMRRALHCSPLSALPLTP